MEESRWYRSQLRAFEEGLNEALKEIKRSKKKSKKRRKPSHPVEIKTKKSKKQKRYEAYKAYINSPQWKALRKLIINERGYFCENCGNPGAVEVHHLTYERLGHEEPEDLRLLCRTCHGAMHGHNPLQ